MAEEYPSDWDRRRKKVYRRDNYECQNCGSKGGAYGNTELHAHHIVPKSKGGTHQLTNLQTLCHDCHRRVHGHPVGRSKKKSSPSGGATDFFAVFGCIFHIGVGITTGLWLSFLHPLTLFITIIYLAAVVYFYINSYRLWKGGEISQLFEVFILKYWDIVGKKAVKSIGSHRKTNIVFTLTPVIGIFLGVFIGAIPFARPMFLILGLFIAILSVNILPVMVVLVTVNTDLSDPKSNQLDWDIPE